MELRKELHHSIRSSSSAEEQQELQKDIDCLVARKSKCAKILGME
jgi:primosomal protein N''